MDIGTVVTIPINKKNTVCVVINKKTYFEVFQANKILKFLIMYRGFEIVVYTNPPFSLELLGSRMCYELMYGDNRVWVFGTALAKNIIKL